MFRRLSEDSRPEEQVPERVDSVLGPGLHWKGVLSGTGGVRIEGTFEGEIALRGMVVVGESGRVTCDSLRAHTLIVAGQLRGDIVAKRVEIAPTGRVWGDVVAESFSTQEGAFLRGKITMEEELDLGLGAGPAAPTESGEEAEEG